VTGRSSHIEDERRDIAALIGSFNEPAPQSLHDHVESLIAAHQKRHGAQRASRRRLSPVALVGAGAVLAAVIVAVIAVGLSTGGSARTVSFRQEAAVTLRAATFPAPSESSAHHTELAAAIDGVAFPYWGERFGWHGTGSRSDRIDGRLVRTVFYIDGAGQRIGYAILAGTPAPRVSGGAIVWRGGVSYRLLRENGASVVAWLREGRLCVVSGRGISSATLLELASWSDRPRST
jgi:hypothetical protein